MDKKIFFFAISLLTAGVIASCYYISKANILFESLESKTNDNQPVYNQIQFFSVGEKDIWMMNQSHHGLGAVEHLWDRVVIIVDKSVSPKTAKYLQLPPGPFKWEDSLASKGIRFRVSCFNCHSNGPRAIRANTENLQLTAFQKVKIAYWNLKIKSYGQIVENAYHSGADEGLKVPFRGREASANEILQVKTCLQCHNSKDPLARQPLTRQNSGTIDFLVKKGLMPPTGLFLSEAEKKQIQKFVLGF